MGCNSSTPVVKIGHSTQENNNNKNTIKQEYNKDKTINGNIVSVSNIKDVENLNSRKLEDQIQSEKNDKISPVINIVDMSVETPMSPTNDTSDEKVKVNSNTDTATIVNDTNNNKNNSDTPSNEEDSFDTASVPLSREAMLNKKHKETEETLNFVYKHSSSIPYAAPTDSNMPNIQPAGNRYANRRRPSGVPPPPRALLSSDPMAKYGKKPLAFAEEEEEED